MFLGGFGGFYRTTRRWPTIVASPWKSGATIAADMLDGLRWWCKQADVPASDATLVYGGNDSQQRFGIPIRPWYAI